MIQNVISFVVHILGCRLTGRMESRYVLKDIEYVFKWRQDLILYYLITGTEISFNFDLLCRIEPSPMVAPNDRDRKK